MQVWYVLHVARWKYRTQKMTQKIAICAPSHNFVGLYLHNWGTYRQSEKNLLSSDISSTCLHNMVNFCLIAAEIVSGVWGTPATFNGSRVLAALLHGSQVVSVSQTLRRWTKGATYARQGDHHVGHWPTFLVHYIFALWFLAFFFSSPNLSDCRLDVYHTSTYYVALVWI